MGTDISTLEAETTTVSRNVALHIAEERRYLPPSCFVFYRHPALTNLRLLPSSVLEYYLRAPNEITPMFSPGSEILESAILLSILGNLELPPGASSNYTFFTPSFLERGKVM
jgi:hypothetical protein